MKKNNSVETAPLPYADMLDAIKDSVFIHDMEGRLVYVNDTACRVRGYSREQMLRMNVRDLVSPAKRSAQRERLQEIKKRSGFTFDSEHVRHDGTVLPVEVRCGLLELGGEPCAICIARDLSEKVRDKETIHRTEDELEQYRLHLESLVAERTHDLEEHQENLRRSRADLAALIANTNDDIWSVDRQCRLLTFNPSFRKDFQHVFGPGLKPGSDIAALAPASAREIWRKNYDRALKGERLTFEHCIKLKGGEKCLEISFSPIRVDGPVLGVSCLARDITARKRTEEALRHAEERSRLILRSAGDGILGVDLEGRLLFANEAAQRMLGWSYEELSGRSLHALIHHTAQDGSRYPVEKSPMYAAYAEGVESRVDTELLWRKDGSSFYVSYAAHPIMKDGRLEGAVVTFNDITEHRKAEEELRRHRESLQNQNIMLTALGKSKTVAAGKPEAAFREASEIAAHALEAEQVSVWLFNEDRSGLICADLYARVKHAHSSGLRLPASANPFYFKVLETERMIAVSDTANDARTNEFRDSYLAPNNISSLLDVAVTLEGKIVGMVRAEHTGAARAWRADELNFMGAISDFTALAILSSERRKLEKLKEFLISAIIHDLNAPLTAIFCASELLEELVKDRLKNDERMLFRNIEEMSGNMKNMISNILDLSKMEEGKMILKYEVIDPPKLLEEAVSAVKIVAEAGRKKIETLVRSGLPEVKADRDIIKRVILNLLGNSLKFSPGGSRIEASIAYDAAREAVVFSVRDNGRGIPEEHHERIFEKFFQAGGTARSIVGGKGLGLAFCRMAVEAHGGRIWVESEPGRGSTFRFTLPVTAPETSARAAGPHAAGGASSA